MQRFLYSIAYLLLLAIPALTLLPFVEINWRALSAVLIVTLIVGGVFDIWATRQNYQDRFFIWEYNSRSILGFRLFGVPIEDFVFFLILTPIFIVVLYSAFEKIFLDHLTNSNLLFGVGFTVLAYYFVYRHAILTKKVEK